MKNETYDSLDHNFQIAIPDSVAEFDKLAKKEGAALSAAVDHEVYHGTLGQIREIFCDLIEEVTGVKRREIGTGKFEGEGAEKEEITVWEKPTVYINRAAAEKKLTGAQPFADLAKRLSVGGDKEVKFDPSVTPRTGKGPGIAKMYISQATAIIDGKPHEDFGNKVVSLPKLNKAFAADLMGRQFATSGKREDDIQALARMLKDRRDATVKAQQLAEAQKFAA